MPIFRVQSVKIYTGQKNLHESSCGYGMMLIKLFALEMLIQSGQSIEVSGHQFPVFALKPTKLQQSTHVAAKPHSISHIWAVLAPFLIILLQVNSQHMIQIFGSWVSSIRQFDICIVYDISCVILILMLFSKYPYGHHTCSCNQMKSTIRTGVLALCRHVPP